MSLSIFFRTFWCGRLVGKDAQGNRYYEDRKKKSDGMPRRWVIYKGRAEATKIPPPWYGWMHYTQIHPPHYHQPYVWEKPHLPNLTGTAYAHRPKSLRGIAPEKDYEAWLP